MFIKVLDKKDLNHVFI